MRRTAKVVVSALLVFGFAFLLRASIPHVPTGTWQAGNPMAVARSGAASVLLSNGNVLITGGDSPTGTLNTAEVMSNAGIFSSVAQMQSPRSGHTATTLQDGRLLITGGITTTGGGATNSAELYDPSANSWTLVSGTMLAARSGHTASLLPDGRVLLAGGTNSGGPVSALEIFDPSSDSFSGAGILGSPVSQHAAATLADGRVLIVGGSDGTNALATTYLFDPSSNSITSGPNLSTPRVGASATTLLDGLVLVAGGNDGSNDLASAEIYDPAANTFSPAPSSLAAPRSGHLAILLPNNNSVLILGGTSAGTDLASAELYWPWTGNFHSTGAMSATRPGLTASPLSVDGVLMAAGGSNLLSTELYGFATVKTDQTDYAPGSIVTITGSGWQPGETVTLTLLESPLIDTHPNLTAVADASGNISNNQFSPDVHDIGIRFYLTTKGSQSQAQTTFIDSVNSVTLTSPTAASPITLSSFPLTANIAFDYSTSTGTTTGVAMVATSPATNSPTTTLTSGLNQSATIPVTLPAATANGTYNASVTVTNATGGGSNQKSDSANSGVHVDVPITQLVFTTAAFQIPVNTCSSKITVESRDSRGTARNPFSNLTVLLSTTSGGGTFYSNSSCSSATTSVVIASNKTSMDFWYKDSNNGRPQITASTSYEAGPTLFATQLETIGTIPAPTIASISPTSATAGDPGFTMSVVGTNFFLNSAVNFAGSQRTTSFVDSTHLNATIPASDLTATGSFNITVTTPAPGGGTSNAVTFTVNPACTAAAVTTRPANQSIPYGQNASFSAVASGNPAPTVQWQVSTNGGSTWTNLSDGGIVTGSTTGTLSLTSPSASLSGNQYRAVFTNTCNGTQTATSSGATLTVNKTSVTATVTANNKTYDGTTTATQNTCTLSGVRAADSANVTCSASTLDFIDKNVGNGKTVNVSGISLSGAAAGNYQLSSTTATGTANITTKAITPTLTAADKAYDGTATEPDGSMSCSLTGVLSGDSSKVSCAATSGTFNTSQVATANLVTATATISGTEAGNYTLGAAGTSTPSASATATAHITAKPVTVKFTAADKFYDGTDTAAVSNCGIATGKVGNDNVTCSVAGGTFASSNASASAQTVSATATLGGTAASNYTVANPVTTTAKINPALVTVTFTASDKFYDGTDTAAVSNCSIATGKVGNDNVTCSVAGGTFASSNASASAQTVSATATLGGTAASNYTVANPVTTTAKINPATPTVTVTDPLPTYDGNPHSATATAKGVGGADVSGSGSFSFTYDGSSTAPTNAKTSYTVVATFTSSDGNYTNASGIGVLTIKKAASATTVTGGTFTYDGAAHEATVLVTGAGGLSLTPIASYGGGCSAAPVHVAETTPTACTASYTFAGDANHLSSNGSDTIVINKAASLTKVTGGTFTFDGAAHAASVLVTGAGGLSLTPLPSYSGGCSAAPVHVAETTPTACTASYTFAADPDHLGSNDSDTIVINKAASLTAVVGGIFTYDGIAHPATVSVTGAGGLNLTPFPNYGGGCSLAPVNVIETSPNACIASYTFGGDGDHYGSTGSATILINKATSTTTIGAGFTIIYDGLPHGVSASVTGAGGLNQSVSVSYNPGASTTPFNPGSYAATATYLGDSNHFGSSAGPVTINITFGACSPAIGPGGVILPPINSDGTSVYPRKGGSTIPVKFRVCNASGVPISNPAAVFAGTGGTLTMLSAVRGTVDAVNESLTGDIPDVAFRWSGDQWIFNMATSNLVAGETYTFRINLAYGPASINFMVGVK